MGGVSVGATRNAQGQRLAATALTFNDEVAIIDLDTMEIRRVKTGIAPFTTAISKNSTVAWVSNWGGRFPRAGERTAAAGPEVNADHMFVDEMPNFVMVQLPSDHTEGKPHRLLQARNGSVIRRLFTPVRGREPLLPLT